MHFVPSQSQAVAQRPALADEMKGGALPRLVRFDHLTRADGMYEHSDPIALRCS